MEIKNFFKKIENGEQPVTLKARTLQIYVIKDVKSGMHDTPFFQPTHAHAARAFKTEVNRQADNNMIYLYPEDFELHYLGEYDQVEGKIKPEYELIAKGPQFKT